ncbi:MAG: transcriptional repressor [Thermoguttaceae bacterium]|nr:transcriptional repressor [Thermoguttaceae bacterium]MDW8079304.1 transcriptional repressor [Thermoguttaceae bacterium]
MHTRKSVRIGRDTRQRRAILEVLRKANGPLTPSEICRWARRRVPSLGIATVYRHLRVLTAAGLLRRVELPGGSARFEWGDIPHHHHFLCRRCTRAFCTSSCRRRLIEAVPRGFKVESHEVTLIGICRQCFHRRKQPRPG